MDSDWTEENSAIKAAGNSNPFSTPEQYFEYLKEQTLDRVNFSDLVEEDKPNFITPRGYFDNLSEAIKSRIKLEEIKSQFSGNGMTVDSDYFKSSRDQILGKVNTQKNNSGNVVRLNQKRWIKYAVAASLVLGFSVSIYIRKEDNSFNSQLSKIPETEIINYLQINSETADITLIIENLDNTELSKFDSGISDEELNQYINTSL